MKRTLISLCLAIAATLAVAQQKSTDSKATDKQKQDKDSEDSQPLFTKKSGFKSSNTTKGSTTLAFNGVDPTTGKVSSSFLAAAPTNVDADKAKKMADSVPKREQLVAFAKEGGLISR